MTDPTTAMATEVAKEIAKQLPIKEAFGAPARQSGQILEDIVKTIQLALAPFQLAGALQDRLRSFIDRSVRAVPEQRRISPPPQVLGPIIEGIRYEPEGTTIDQMFSELLSTSMDQARINDVHPAFAGLVKALSADEARILQSLTHKPIEQVTTSKLDRARNLFEPPIFETLDLPDGLEFPSNGRVYLEHLRQLGLIEISVTRSPEPIMNSGVQVGVRNFGEHQLSLWGRQFTNACSGESAD
jgi:hypothetical protein